MFYGMANMILTPIINSAFLLDFIERYNIPYLQYVMPIELSRKIQDYARPISRINWKKGGSFKSELFVIGVLLRFSLVDTSIQEQIIKYIYSKKNITEFMNELKKYDIKIKF